MTDAIQAVINVLKEKKISYTLQEHPAVYTIEEMAALKLPNFNCIAKNLFLRDDKKRSYYIVVVHEEKRVNLKALRTVIGSRPLSFASEADLDTYLGLIKGSVTPLGILNDDACKVEVLVDEAFRDGTIGVHPNDNRATVWLKTADLVRLITDHGNMIRFITVEDRPSA